MHINYRIWALLGILLLSFGAPMAIAGPQEDAELAEDAYKKSDLISAMRLWRKAAEQGHAPAQARLGNVLETTGDDEEAVEWYQKAANQGNAAGEYSLGRKYLEGKGLKQDEEKARSLILQAANKNYAPAMKTVMDFYKTGRAGLPLDLEQARIWEDKICAAIGECKPAIQPVPETGKKK